MQKIAREFNFSETTFVFPPNQGNTRHVRIFTPSIEIPFAGHPNIGTAFVLFAIDLLDGQNKIVFEEKAGLVPISLDTTSGDGLKIELQAPETLTIGKSVSIHSIALALGLEKSWIETENHEPIVASVGLPFVMVELKDISCLQKVKINLKGFSEISSYGINPDILVYVRSEDEFDIRARMFAPFDGVPEDPATGSANCALAGLLAQNDSQESGVFSLRVGQGIEMGRPSLLESQAKKQNGKVVSTSVKGESVLIAEGYFYGDELS